MHHLIISGCHLMALESDLDAASICCCQNTHLNEFGVTPSICVSHSLTISFKSVCKQSSTVTPCTSTESSISCFNRCCFFLILQSSLCRFFILSDISLVDKAQYGTLLLGSVRLSVLFSKRELHT